MGSTASHDRASTVLLADTTTPASFEAVLRFSTGISILTCVILVYFIIVVARALRREDRNLKRAAVQKQTMGLRTLREMLVFLILCLLMALVTFPLLHFLPLTWRACSYLGIVPGIFYSLTRFFCYRVLIMRTRAVQGLMPQWFTTALQFARLATLGVFPIIVGAGLYASGKLVFREQHCTQHMAGLVPVVGAIVDGMLSFLLLFLFLVPFVIEMRRTKGAMGTQERGRLLRAATRNWLLSSFSIVTSSIFMVGVTVTSRRVAQDDDADSQQWRLFTGYGSSLDVLCNATALVMLYQRLIFKKDVQTRLQATAVAPASTGTSTCQ